LKIRVFVVEDHTIVRQGLIALLESCEDLLLVGEEGDGRRALAAIPEAQPDVVLCDLALPGLSGLEILQRLQELESPPKVLILSMYHDPVWVQRAVEAGAKGYLLKGAGVQDVTKAIRAVAAGETFLSPGAQRSIHASPLSPREREILTLLASGHTSKEMGGILGISPRTAEHHRARLMSKLNINDVAGLTRYAIRNGFVDQNLR